MVVFPPPALSETDDDSDDASSNSCMVFSFKTHTKSSKNIVLDDDEDCFSDDVWNFSSADKSISHKRQKCREVDGSSSPATDLLNSVLLESQLTLDQFMDMKLDMLSPPSTSSYHTQPCLMHKFSANRVDMSRMARTYV